MTHFGVILDPFLTPPGLSGVDSFLSLLRSFSHFGEAIFLRRVNFFLIRNSAKGFSLSWAERFWMTERIVLETLRVIIHETLRVMLTLPRVSDWRLG